MRSPYSQKNQSDVQSTLYNLRYAVSFCLFGVPFNRQLINTPCITSKTCGPFRDAIEFGNLLSTYKSYEYCRQWPTDTNVDYRGCTDCLQAAESFHLANFVTVLQAGCEQRPAPGIGLGFRHRARLTGQRLLRLGHRHGSVADGRHRSRVVRPRAPQLECQGGHCRRRLRAPPHGARLCHRPQLQAQEESVPAEARGQVRAAGMAGPQRLGGEARCAHGPATSASSLGRHARQPTAASRLG